jgi:hypothetical protein
MFGYFCLPKSKTIIYNITMKKSRKIVALLSALMLLPAVMTGAETTFKISERYLNIPVSHKVDRSRLTFTAKGIPELSVVVRVAPDEADYWVFKDMSAYKGQNVTLTYDGDERGLPKHGLNLTGHGDRSLQMKRTAI